MPNAQTIKSSYFVFLRDVVSLNLSKVLCLKAQTFKSSYFVLKRCCQSVLRF